MRDDQHFFHLNDRIGAYKNGPDQVVEHLPRPNPIPRLSRRWAAMQSTEIWKPVVGYEGLYEVSDQGRVKSLGRVITRVDGRQRTWGERIMKLRLGSSGRFNVVLYNRGKDPKVRQVHQLVLEAFVGPREKGMEGCHNDGNPLNNHLSNLRWDTKSGNMLDAVRHGTHVEARKTHCPRGHEYADFNLVPSSLKLGNRRCLACHREQVYAGGQKRPFDPKLADARYEAMVSEIRAA